MNINQPTMNFGHPDGEPVTTIVLVTPEMAAAWLQENTQNRPVSPRHVNAYARDMAAGNWELNGESIKFSKTGRLLDGQHRLLAIIKAGVSVRIAVTRGVDPKAQRSMDAGKARTASDALTIKGEKHTTHLAAMARIALAVEAGGNLASYPATHAEVENFVEEHPDARYSAQIASKYHRGTDCPPAVVAYTHWAFAQIDPVAADEFWYTAAEKVGLTAGDPIIALTNRLAEARRARKSLSREALISLVFRAWNYRRQGKTTRMLRVESPAGGVVPIPRIR